MPGFSHSLASLTLILGLTTVAVYPNGMPELSSGAASYPVTVANRSVFICVTNDTQNLYVAVRVFTPNKPLVISLVV